MPLPAALAARLAKRGIIGSDALQNVTPERKEEKEIDTQEEIIAEDYDETPQETTPSAPQGPVLLDKTQGWPACPNKWNVYHECTANCADHWKEPKVMDKMYNQRRIKMLRKYPLPDHWREILDVGIGHYYYWNTETDLVSWLPPGHPKCQVSRSAAYLRKHMIQEREERLQEESRLKRKDKGNKSDAESDEDTNKRKKIRINKDDGSSAESDESGEDLDDSEKKKSFIRRERKGRERERGGRDKRRRGRGEDALDPMDPASYGDCPRGTWSSGLPMQNEARTGADTTASGPLFQMRPYPNPGSVLRANAAAGSNAVGPKKPQT